MCPRHRVRMGCAARGAQQASQVLPQLRRLIRKQLRVPVEQSGRLRGAPALLQSLEVPPQSHENHRLARGWIRRDSKRVRLRAAIQRLEPAHCWLLFRPSLWTILTRRRSVVAFPLSCRPGYVRRRGGANLASLPNIRGSCFACENSLSLRDNSASIGCPRIPNRSKTLPAYPVGVVPEPKLAVPSPRGSACSTTVGCVYSKTCSTSLHSRLLQ